MEIVGVEIRDAFSPVLELCGLGTESVAGGEKTVVRVQGALESMDGSWGDRKMDD